MKNISLLESSSFLTFLSAKRFDLIPSDSLKLGETHKDLHKIGNFTWISLTLHNFLRFLKDFFEKKSKEFISVFHESNVRYFSIGLDNFWDSIANKFSHIFSIRKKDQTIYQVLGSSDSGRFHPSFLLVRRTLLISPVSRIPTLDETDSNRTVKSSSFYVFENLCQIFIFLANRLAKILFSLYCLGKYLYIRRS